MKKYLYFTKRISGLAGLLLIGVSLAGAADEKTVPDIGLVLEPIPAGNFIMGSPPDEPGHSNNESQCMAVITKNFWMGKTEVTQAQWKAIMGTTLKQQAALALQDNTTYNMWGVSSSLNVTIRAYFRLHDDSGPNSGYIPMYGNAEDSYPMYWVSWDEAKLFCKKLTEREQAAGRLPTGYEYSLPTEAQWEYACRAGTSTATYAGPLPITAGFNAPELDPIAWYGGNSCHNYSGRGWSQQMIQLSNRDNTEREYPGRLAGPREVATRKANAWGLEDTLGNVWEWCLDDLGEYPTGIVTDPLGKFANAGKVLRGGSWNNPAEFCRAAARTSDPQTYRFYCIGFRIALVPSAK